MTRNFGLFDVNVELTKLEQVPSQNIARALVSCYLGGVLRMSIKSAVDFHPIEAAIK